MPIFKHIERRRFPYTPRQLFDLVADVEKYPQFIDWFVSAHIRHRAGNLCEVDQVVRYGGLSVAFASRAVLDPPQRIRVTSTDFPFRSFDQHWTFTPEGHSGTLVQYDVAFELRFGFLLHGLMDLVADQRQIAATTIDMFQRRALQLYGHAA
jgi:coenzyme Q-binding protein COQ10